MLPTYNKVASFLRVSMSLIVAAPILKLYGDWVSLIPLIPFTEGVWELNLDASLASTYSSPTSIPLVNLIDVQSRFVQ